MIACLDAGNSRLKWGLVDASGWWKQGALEWSDASALPSLIASWPPVSRVVLASVAGGNRESLIREALGDLPLSVVCSSACAGGVRSAYAKPETLGVDRWCALMGARSLVAGACLVVTAGTATTIDSLDASGYFLGGLILPGVTMMQQALARGTAQLPMAKGEYQSWPCCTQDAIYSGCLEAHVGAVERAFERLPGAEVCLLSGGAASALAPYLTVPVRVVENIVLEGLRQLTRCGEPVS